MNILSILSLLWLILKWPLAILIGLTLISMLLWGLVPAIFISQKKLSVDLQGKHDDWWPILRLIPKRISALVNIQRDMVKASGTREFPVQILGSNRRILNGVFVQDVPDKGTYCLSLPFHFAKVFKGGFGLAFGIRKTYWTTDGKTFWNLRFVCRKLYK